MSDLILRVANQRQGSYSVEQKMSQSRRFSIVVGISIFDRFQPTEFEELVPIVKDESYGTKNSLFERFKNS